MTDSFVSGCGHCTQMKPAYSEAAKRLADENVGILAAVDATTSEALSQKFKVKGFPTLKFFENGVLKSEYNGKRSADDLYNFVKNSDAQSKDEL